MNENSEWIVVKFPILGGRLLKKDLINFLVEVYKVSNPWREAIEVTWRG